MVSALSRNRFDDIQKEENDCSNSFLFFSDGSDKSPCALREFINSNADLPTVEELVKKSTKLARAIGLLY